MSHDGDYTYPSYASVPNASPLDHSYPYLWWEKRDVWFTMTPEARTKAVFKEKAAIHIQKEARRFLADKEVKALKQSQDAAARWSAQAKAEEGAAAAQAAGTAL